MKEVRRLRRCETFGSESYSVRVLRTVKGWVGEHIAMMITLESSSYTRDLMSCTSPDPKGSTEWKASLSIMK